MAESVKDIAQRLIQTREALGLTQAAFADAISTEKNVYNPFERAHRRITLDVALKIRKRFGVPLDWIYCGDPSHLPSHIYRKLKIFVA